MKNPKVLFIGPLPPPYSGPELSMKQFLDSKTLQNTFSISFLQTNFRKSNKLKGKFGIGMMLNFFIYFFRLLLFLSKRPELIYYPVTPTQLGWLGRDIWTILLSKMFGAKVIIHLRGSHFKLNFQSFKPWVKILIGFSLKRVDGAIVQANYLKDQFAPFIAKEKMHTLYQSMDPCEFPLADRNTMQKGKILVVGHMTKAKGYTDIVKIIPRVAEKYPYVEFCFAGEMRKGERGVFYNQFTNERIMYEDPFEIEKRILNSKYTKNYNNLGLISGENKLHHLSTADFFISASYSEGFSRALLEAMSVGLPLIFTPVGAHREILTEINGISIIPGDLENLTKSILTMLENANLDSFSKRNRKQVENNFSVKKICDEFKNILIETLNL